MTVQIKVIGRMPSYHGDYDPQVAYGKKYQVTLFGCVWESKHDNNNTAPATWDGGKNITPNTTDWLLISGSYEAWLMDQDRPANSQDYPFNNMGYVVLPMNIQDVSGTDKNLLTQDMFYKDGPNNTRVPNTNTIFEIRYDFELAENITIPSGCVLKFEGGSVSNASGSNYTFTGTNTQIKAGKEAIFTNMFIAGTWNCPVITSAWFSDAANENVLKQVINLTDDNVYNTVSIESGDYAVKPTSTASSQSPLLLKSNTKIVLIGNIIVSKTSLLDYRIISLGVGTSGTSNIVITGNGSIVGEALQREEFLADPVYNQAMIIGGSNPKNILIENITISNSLGTCIGLSGNMENAVVRNVKMLDSWWYGASITRSKNISIENCYFYGLYAGGIDIEPQSGGHVQNVTIKDCEFTNCRKGFSITDINCETAVKNVLVENCLIHNPWIFQDDSNQSCIRLRCAIDGFIMRNCKVEAGSIKALLVQCMTAVNDTVFNRRALCSGVIIENCILSTDASNGLEVFWPYIEIRNCKITTKRFGINKDFSDVFPSSADQSLKSAAGFRTLMTLCDLNISEYINNDSSIVFDNNNITIGGDGSSSNVLGYRCKIINNRIILGKKKIYIGEAEVNNNLIDIESGFSDDNIISIYSNCKFINNCVRLNSYNLAASNLTSLIYCSGGKVFSKIIHNELDARSQDGSIKAITSHSNVKGHIISENYLIQDSDGYILATDPYDNNVRLHMLGENFGTINSIGTTNTRNNITSQQLNCVQTGFEYFDSDLGKPVYWNGSGWVDATGATV